MCKKITKKENQAFRIIKEAILLHGDKVYISHSGGIDSTVVEHIGRRAEESELRKTNFKKYGAIGNKKATPIADWSKQDVWDYVKKYDLEYSDFYKKGGKRSGCISCYMGFQFQLKQGVDRVQSEMGARNPKQYQAHMNYKHKGGMTFRESVERMKRIFLQPNYIVAHTTKLDFLYKLQDKLQSLNIEYNSKLLESAIGASEKAIKKRTILDNVRNGKVGLFAT